MAKRLYGLYTKLFFLGYYPYAYVRNWMRREPRIIEEEASSVLLCSQGSLGDLFLAGFALNSVKRTWPKAKIGLVINPGSKAVLSLLEGVDVVHEIPPWKRKGKLLSLLSLLYHTLFIYPHQVNSIRREGYSIGIELSPFFPSSIPLMYKAHIPRRVGFTSSGYAIFLTDPIDFPGDEEYLPLLFPLLLRPLGVEVSFPVLPPSQRGAYVVLHMGSSDLRKEWDPSHWKEVALALRQRGYQLIFTGQGKRERELAEQLSFLGENKVGSLTLKEFCALIAGSFALLSVDTLSIHLASWLHVPFLGLYLYSEGVELWLPKDPFAFFVISKQAKRRCPNVQHERAVYVDEVIPSHVLKQFFCLEESFPV